MSPADAITVKLGVELFSTTLCHCLSSGYVVSTPDYFFMGRAVTSGVEDSVAVDLTAEFRPEVCDAWFVAGMAGDMQKALDAVPYFLPWFIFQRDNGKVRRYTAESLTQAIYGKRSTRPK